MSPGNGEGRPRQGAPTPSNVQNLDKEQATPTLGQSPLRRTELVNVWAHGFFTVGTRGRLALTMIVTACVFCGRAHRHNGRPDFISGKRTASCGHGRYVVHLGTLEGQVAA